MRKLPAILCVCFMVSACSHSLSTTISESELAILVDKSIYKYVDELSDKIALFNNVAFGLGLPLRKYLNDENTVDGKTVLDLGTGSGVLSLIAIKNGARKSVATDINPYAVENAIYNARQFGYQDKMEVRLVPMDRQDAYSVLKKGEKFDIVVSNPPQSSEEPKTLYEYSYANPELAFLRSILEGLKDHLTPSGKGIFTLYDNGLMMAREVASAQGLKINILLKTKNKNGIYYLVAIEPS